MKIRDFLMKHHRKITAIHTITKLIVFVTLIYTAMVMYFLGNLVLSGVIALVVVLYLILTKLDSLISGS